MNKMSKDRKNQLSKLMQDAWLLVKNYGLTMKEAMVKAWAILKLKKQMLKGIVKFYYQKVSGEVREAYGTLKEGIVPATQGTGRKATGAVFTYWDCERLEFRCFKKANLLRIVK